MLRNPQRMHDSYDGSYKPLSLHTSILGTNLWKEMWPSASNDLAYPLMDLMLPTDSKFRRATMHFEGVWVCFVVFFGF